ncbi:MAG: SUMF1/EgtB/PvdO family nonheme iron enzyme [Rhodothermaceae bacterium]|nr:SUMF1/EgtB/PvdO family nonheme iron enzyme [Rhodothermaceae bacterium]
MVAIEGGRFDVGDVFERTDPDATPVHPATVGDFFLGRYEVTYDQYDAFAAATGRPLPSDDEVEERGRRAVAYVTWDDALAFCAAYGYRLPTETEWEFAARERGQARRYPGFEDVSDVPRYGWVGLNDAPASFPVGMKEPNALGLYDLSGNVYEWIGAFYQFYPEPGVEPEWHDMAVLNMRLIRGGSFRQEADLAQTFRRAGTLRDVAAEDIGFRCAASAETD